MLKRIVKKVPTLMWGCLLLLVVMLTGCGRNFDSSGYVTSIMDTLYKGNYTSYMDFTGVSRSDVSPSMP